MNPPGHATRAQAAWRDADLRIWCIGGWWFQIKGEPRQRLDGGDAASELLRHLALDLGEMTTRTDLQRWLARKPKTEIGGPSLSTAVSTARSILREAAGDRDDADKLASDLIPRPKTTTTADGMSSEVTYELATGSVWVDLKQPSPNSLGADLLPPAFELEPVDGRGAKGEFQGEQRWRRKLGVLAEETSEAGPEAGLDPHLKRMTPPISNLTKLVPLALDRLGPGKLLTIQAPADSGRMHLAEAIQFAAHIYCGRTTEEIREEVEGGTVADNLSGWRPGHLCVLDATRDVRGGQIARLREIAGSEREARPSLLIVHEAPLEEDLASLVRAWDKEEPIELPTAGSADILEAFLIGTVDEGSLGDRIQTFAQLRETYEERYEKAPIGLRAAVSAASIVAKGHAQPDVRALPEPPSSNFSFDGLPKDLQKVARSLAWFGNRPFDLADARAVTGMDSLEEGSIFGVATKIPGGDGIFELRPQLLDRRPPRGASQLICRYLVTHSDVEPVIERWPGRALRILARNEIPIEERLELAMRLFEPCRTQGLAPQLAAAMEILRGSAGGVLDEKRAEFWIVNARLLAYLDHQEEKRKEEADLLLREVLAAAKGRKGGRWPGLRAGARLRRAIVASLRGDPKLARKEAERAGQDTSMLRKVENFYGWEAIKSGRLEEAATHFRLALEADAGEGVDDRADAAIGLARSLIRLDRCAEAEKEIRYLNGLKLRRHTRDRLARVNAALCQMHGEPSVGIDRYIDPALLDAGFNVSASALLLEASAFLHLEANEVNAAAEDIERSRSILGKSEPNSAGRYVRALIYEAEAESARGQAASDRIKDARREAGRCIGKETDRDPWSRARAQTLRGRLALLDGMPGDLAEPLREALEAHRELGVVCPELSQTLALAGRAASTWRAREQRERAEELMRGFHSRRPQDRPSLDDVLDLVGAVLERVEAGPPAVDLTGNTGLELLERVGESIIAATARAQMAGLRLQVLIPRELKGLSPGIYEPTPERRELRRCLASPSRPLGLITSSEERRPVQQYATCVLLASMASGEAGAFVALGEWIAWLRGDACGRGIAVGDPIGVDAAGLAKMEETGPASVVAVPLAELPVLI
jgi:hypothetical protein